MLFLWVKDRFERAKLESNLSFRTLTYSHQLWTEKASYVRRWKKTFQSEGEKVGNWNYTRYMIYITLNLEHLFSIKKTDQKAKYNFLVRHKGHSVTYKVEKM